MQLLPLLVRNGGMTRTTEPTARVADMFAQSTAVLARPTPQTFERFERRGGVASALLYVLVAALVSGMVGALFSVFHSDVTFWGQLVSRLIAIPLQFLVFTGAVYLIGRGLFRGTGTYPEVAYTFALFFVPLSILGSLLGLDPTPATSALLALGLGVGAVATTLRGIALSARLALGLEVLSIGLVIAVLTVLLVVDQGGGAVNEVTTATPGVGGLAIGAVLAVAGFMGFESAAVVATHG